MSSAKRQKFLSTKMTVGLVSLLTWLALFQASCGSRTTTSVGTANEEESLSRTEFTARVENFFEYEPLKAGKASQFLIHLTDLSDGSPVEKAEVTLMIRPKGGGAEIGKTAARVGKVTGIYVADVTITKPGDYDIEFHVRNAKLDERMPLKDFKVE
jgi:hypothetical protein